MKTFEYPEIDIVSFVVEDVISTSVVEVLENMTDKG